MNHKLRKKLLSKHVNMLTGKIKREGHQILKGNPPNLERIWHG